MTSEQFVIWLKGFTEACNDFTATPKQWDRIKEVLGEVEDYNDNPGIDVEIDDWRDWTGNNNPSIVKGVLNDQTGKWNYTNSTEGFGYYHNKENEKPQINKEKTLLND